MISLSGNCANPPPDSIPDHQNTAGTDEALIAAIGRCVANADTRTGNEDSSPTGVAISLLFTRCATEHSGGENRRRNGLLPQSRETGHLPVRTRMRVSQASAETDAQFANTREQMCASRTSAGVIQLSPMHWSQSLAALDESDRLLGSAMFERRTPQHWPSGDKCGAGEVFQILALRSP